VISEPSPTGRDTAGLLSREVYLHPLLRGLWAR
jgi:hypothetical protein